jgi:hypothetical protein
MEVRQSADEWLAAAAGELLSRHPAAESDQVQKQTVSCLNTTVLIY